MKSTKNHSSQKVLRHPVPQIPCTPQFDAYTKRQWVAAKNAEHIATIQRHEGIEL